MPLRRPPTCWGSPPEPSATDYRAELLPSTKEDGTVYVLLPDDMSRDAERDPDDTPGGMPPSDSDTLTSELRDRLRYVEGQLEAERQAHAEARCIIAGLVERMPQLEAPRDERESPESVEQEAKRGRHQPRSGAPGAQEGTRRPQPASGVLGNAAILTLFVVGLLLVSGAAAFAAYMYEDPVFGPFVSVLPITSLVAGAFGGSVGYVAGSGTDFIRFLVGGGVMGLVAMAVAHFASVMVKGEGPADWGRSFFAMGLVLMSTWAMFTSGAYIGKVILLRSG